MAKNKKRIVVLGGGFAGAGCVRKLESYFRNDEEIEIVLISEDNFILSTPMLPQVASGMAEARHIITPIRGICKKTMFYEGQVMSIDPHGKVVNLRRTGRKRGIGVRYDFLVIALGCKTNFFGMKDVEKHARTMKTLNDALILRNKAMDMLEQAETESDPIHRKSMLTFVIVGGGFAGIETAGELMDLLLDVKKHYPHIQKDHISVTVIESGSRIILGFDDKMAKFAYEAVTKRGIDIRLNCAVSSFNGIEATVKKLSGEEAGQEDIIRTNTLVWTAGIAAADAIRNSILKTEKGKLAVNEFLELPRFPGVFAVGDCTLCINPETERPFPPTARVAEAQAKIAAANLYALIRNKQKKKFEFKAKGHMAIIGKRAGIATFMGRNIVGFWAWVLWRNMYLSSIPNTEKKIRVLLDWTIDLFFGRDVSRLDTMKKPRNVGFREAEEQDVW